MKISKIFVFLIAIIALSAYATAVNLDITGVEINGRKIYEANNHTINYKYEKGEKLDIDVCVQALTDAKDIQIQADIVGYRYSTRDTQHPVSDSTDTFDLSQGDNECQTLRLVIPDMIDNDYYKLRIWAADRDGLSVQRTYELHLNSVAASNAVMIKDYTFNPTEIVAGRAFTADVIVKNIGTKDLQDTKVTISIPDINVQASEYMDELDADDSKTFDELLLRIPDCTKPGTYDVNIIVDFDEYEETQVTGQITVKAGDTCGAATTGTNTGNTGAGTTQPDKSTISVPNTQEVSAGSSIVYPVMITNNGPLAKTYTLSISGVTSWGSTRIDPNAVLMIPSQQSKTAYIYVNTNSNAQPGDKVMTLTIDTGTETKQVSLITKIAGAQSTNGVSSADWSSFKSWLEIGLVVLVIILLIIGLIIGFNKMKDNKDEPENYY